MVGENRVEEVGDRVRDRVVVEKDIAEYESIGIGVEQLPLVASDVVVSGLKVVNVDKFGDKLVVIVNHPIKSGVEIGKVRYLRANQVREAGLWFKLDADGLIANPSALASLMEHYGCENLSQLRGKTLQTVVGDGGFLVFKAY